MRFPVAVVLALLAAGLASAPSRVAAQAATAPAAPQLTAGELDLLLAPVALYPDQLLAQMLLAAATPPKAVELDAFLKKNPSLKGTALQERLQADGYPPALVTLAVFPDVVAYMAGDVTWTTQLGEAFAADRKAVLASVQRLREQSQKVGTLKSTPQQQVENRTTDAGQQVIVIEPTNPQVVYVPQYNPQTVYTQPTTSTVVIQEDDDDDGAAAAAGVIGFATGVAIGAAFDNDYYYGPYGWRGGAYMYDDAWDDWYDEREDAREDWADHREDLAEERGERAGEAREERTERQQTRQENRPEAQAQLEQRRSEASAQASTRSASQEARGNVDRSQTSGVDRSGSSSGAFSGYSSGRSERAASSRGNRSRGSSGGGRSRRR